MLVLTRRAEETLTIGSENDALGIMTVKVLSIIGNYVKLGLTMNDSIPVYRAEIWQRMRNDSFAKKDIRNTR